jgi:dTDP-4-dehydrorhamnose reductase
LDKPATIEKLSQLQWPAEAKRPTNSSLDSSLIRSKLELPESDLGRDLGEFCRRLEF